MKKNGFDIISPKQRGTLSACRAGMYPYYAGFSPNFVYRLLKSLDLPKGATVADPWNGSGTTTYVTSNLNYRALGYDLNPAMVVAAKARMLSTRTIPSVAPLAEEIVKDARQLECGDENSDEPLCVWFTPRSAVSIRCLERCIHATLVSNTDRLNGFDNDPTYFSDLASFYYLALFHVVRQMLTNYQSSNPTWLKRPKSKHRRLRPTPENVDAAFLFQVQRLIELIQADPGVDRDDRYEISCASSTALPCADETSDAVVASPPYCTRIDYAIATSPELMVLGFDTSVKLRQLRDGLIGTPTITAQSINIATNWGTMCSDFLDRVSVHSAKASKTYYLRGFLQYFDGMYTSLKEIARILKPGSICGLVVQDSYYKDIHVNLQGILAEMARTHRLIPTHQVDFGSGCTMANVNVRARRYKERHRPLESVLILKKK